MLSMRKGMMLNRRRNVLSVFAAALLSFALLAALVAGPASAAIAPTVTVDPEQHHGGGQTPT